MGTSRRQATRPFVGRSGVGAGFPTPEDVSWLDVKTSLQRRGPMTGVLGRHTPGPPLFLDDQWSPSRITSCNSEHTPCRVRNKWDVASFASSGPSREDKSVPAIYQRPKLSHLGEDRRVDDAGISLSLSIALPLAHSHTILHTHIHISHD